MNRESFLLGEVRHRAEHLRDNPELYEGDLTDAQVEEIVSAAKVGLDAVRALHEDQRLSFAEELDNCAEIHRSNAEHNDDVQLQRWARQIEKLAEELRS